MKVIRLSLILPVISFSLSARGEGGFEVGNGGDAVYCEPSASEYNGYYTLDFLAIHPSDPGEFVPVASWEASQLRIETLLEAKFPDLAYLFRQFSEHISNHSNWDRPRIWRAARAGLIDIEDDELLRLLPGNCGLSPFASDDISLVQAVIHTYENGMHIYDYDPDIFDALAETGPEQTSFMYVHEFLWDVVDSAREIRRINWLLHSIALESYSPEELKRALRNLGLDLANLIREPRDFCKRMDKIRDFIELNMAASCRDIETLNPDNFTYRFVPRRETRKSFILENTEIPYIPISDLAGLQGFQNIGFINTGLEHVFASQFRSLFRLRRIILRDNQLTAIRPGTFQDQWHLSVLDLSGNQIRSLQGSELAPHSRLVELNLRNNRISYIDPEFFERLQVIKLDIANNRLTDIPDDFCQEVRWNSNTQILLQGNSFSPFRRASLAAICARDGCVCQF